MDLVFSFLISSRSKKKEPRYLHREIHTSNFAKLLSQKYMLSDRHVKTYDVTYVTVAAFLSTGTKILQYGA